MWGIMPNEKNRQDSGKRDLREQIDQNLRRVYQDALEEDVPERFLKLIEELRQKTGRT